LDNYHFCFLIENKYETVEKITMENFGSMP